MRKIIIAVILMLTVVVAVAGAWFSWRGTQAASYNLGVKEVPR